MEDKSKLLSELKIDRSDDSTAGGTSTTLVITYIALALLVGGASTYFYIGDQANAPTPQARTVTATKATSTQSQQADTAQNNAPAQAQDTSNRLLNASGYITARRIATVSAEIMGLITDVLVEEGMEVVPGQVLAKLDDAVATGNLKLAKAQVDVQLARIQSTKANLDEARRVLSRATELRANDFSTDADVTRTAANVASLEAQIKSAEADIEVARIGVALQQEHLDNHTIKAPFGGVVTVKNAQPGEIVAPSSAGGGFTRTGICTIVDMDSLEIEVDVNEAFIGRVFNGQKVEANLDAYPSWTIPASVIAIIPTADRAKATVRVRIRIEEKDSRILPDMGVKVAFLK